jgi:hypothetical protein
MNGGCENSLQVQIEPKPAPVRRALLRPVVIEKSPVVAPTAPAPVIPEKRDLPENVGEWHPFWKSMCEPIV